MKFIKYRDMSRDAKQLVWIYGTLLVVVTASVVWFNAYVSADMSGAVDKGNTPSSTEIEKTSPTETTTEVTETEPALQPQVTETKPVVREAPVERVSEQTRPTESVPAKTEPLDGGHIPFTNKPVTPGDPASYANTVGQCPFYEMAYEKGCVPPPDIECNADWSVCTLTLRNGFDTIKP